MLGAASVILDDAGRVLLVKHGYGARNWELPGGACEPGESAEEGACREAREEAGVRISIGRLVGVYWEPASGMHHFAFRASTSESPYAADPHEITELGWFGAGVLPRPMSDFTLLRITDALSGDPARLRRIGPRVWLR